MSSHKLEWNCAPRILAPARASVLRMERAVGALYSALPQLPLATVR